MYDAKIKEFIRTYVKAISESNAAIFAGAGLSQPAGYVDWKELMREVAEDLNLDIDIENDLIALAQYHVNEFYGRSKINQILVDEFTKDVKATENHKVLARLPINTYWTTNYDKLLEINLEKNDKKVDVKMVPENLSHTMANRDVTVYKMHGDSTLAHQAVLTKDDYEGYDINRKLFSTALQGDLVSKTFLFIGFSFDDPNLVYILSRIRILLGENSRNHYCFMKKIDRNSFKDEEEFRYANLKQDLRISDLKRYKINVLLVEEYEEITKILHHIERIIRRKNIFISGSAAVYKDWEENTAFEFSTQLSKTIIKNENNIVTGFGLGIGSSLISGALEELYQNNVRNIEDRLKSKPFPQNTSGDIPLKELWTKYREEMLSNVGVSIFIFGNKKDMNSNALKEADGMIEEFKISTDKGAIPIPVGATGFTAYSLWKEVMDNFEKYIGIPSLKTLYEVIGDSTKSKEEIIDAIVNIINELAEY